MSFNKLKLLLQYLETISLLSNTTYLFSIKVDDSSRTLSKNTLVCNVILIVQGTDLGACVAKKYCYKSEMWNGHCNMTWMMEVVVSQLWLISAHWRKGDRRAFKTWHICAYGSSHCN